MLIHYYFQTVEPVIVKLFVGWLINALGIFILPTFQIADGVILRQKRTYKLTRYTTFESLTDLNEKTHAWVEDEYNTKHHAGIQMIPVDRFNLDHTKIQFLTDDQYTAEVFFIEVERKVSKTNVFSINNQKYECPVNLRQKTVQVRYDRSRQNRFIVYFADKRMGGGIRLCQYIFNL